MSRITILWHLLIIFIGSSIAVPATHELLALPWALSFACQALVLCLAGYFYSRRVFCIRLLGLLLVAFALGLLLDSPLVDIRQIESATARETLIALRSPFIFGCLSAAVSVLAVIVAAFLPRREKAA